MCAILGKSGISDSCYFVILFNCENYGYFVVLFLILFLSRLSYLVACMFFVFFSFSVVIFLVAVFVCFFVFFLSLEFKWRL